MIDIATAPAGSQLGPYAISFSKEQADAYAAAVGGEGSPDYGGALPPAAIIAAGLARLIEELDLFNEQILKAGGVIHTSQEAEFFAPVAVGEQVTATAKLAGNMARRGSRFVSVFTEFRNAANEVVATASSTIVVPE